MTVTTLWVFGIAAFIADALNGRLNWFGISGLAAVVLACTLMVIEWLDRRLTGIESVLDLALLAARPPSVTQLHERPLRP